MATVQRIILRATAREKKAIANARKLGLPISELMRCRYYPARRRNFWNACGVSGAMRLTAPDILTTSPT